MAGLLAELKRRNVFRVAGLYLVVAWLLMQVATILETSLKLPDWFDGLVTALVLLGFPLALILAWAFELTPDGVRLTSPSAADSAPVRFRGWDALMLVVLIAVGGLIAADWFSIQRITEVDVGTAPSAAEPAATSPGLATADGAAKPRGGAVGNGGVSVAVLPFADMSPSKDQEYFSDGLAEELLNALTRLSNLKVAGRTSSFAFKGKNIDLREIAKSLNVTHVLEGSVRRAGDRIRVTAQLIEAQDGFHVFSETYERELRDVFRLQDDISTRIAKALELRLTGAASKRPKNGEAYELYLRAREHLHQRELSTIQTADRLLDRAIVLAPTYAPVLAAKALSTMLLSNAPGCYGDRDAAEALPEAKTFIDRAMAQDPNLAEAHAVLGLFLRNSGTGAAEAAAALRRALELNPNLSDAKLWLANSLGNAESFTILESIVERDPGFYPAIKMLASHYAMRMERESLERLLDRAERIPGVRPRIIAIRGYIALTMGDVAAAYRHLSAAAASNPGNAHIQEALGYTLLDLKEVKRALEIDAPSSRLSALAMRGKIDEAHEIAKRHLDDPKVVVAAVRALTVFERYEAAAALIDPPSGAGMQAFAAANPSAVTNVVLVYRALGRKAEAERALSKIQQLADTCRELGYENNPANLVFLAEYEALSGRLDEAEALFVRAVKRGYVGVEAAATALKPLQGRQAYRDAVAMMNVRIDEARKELGWAPKP